MRIVHHELPSHSLSPPSGPVRERRDAAVNRRRILEATRRLLAEHPPHEVSMEDVARYAGVGKGTVFRRFGDRAGLFDALLDDAMRNFQDAFLSGPPPLGPGAPPAERLEAFFAAAVRFQRRHIRLMLAVEPHRSRRGSYGAFLIHVRSLIVTLDPMLPADALAAMLLGAIAPPILEQIGSDLGIDEGGLVTSAIALLRGVCGLQPGGVRDEGRQQGASITP